MQYECSLGRLADFLAAQAWYKFSILENLSWFMHRCKGLQT